MEVSIGLGSLEGDDCPESGLGFAAETASLQRKDGYQAVGVALPIGPHFLWERDLLVELSPTSTGRDDVGLGLSAREA